MTGVPKASGRVLCADRLVLVGMMGAGKSTVGRLLAARLGCSAVDTDEIVERSRVMSVAEIFVREGEAAFREAESEALASLRDMGPRLVASVGGGAVLRPENRTAMRRAGTVVWLRARPGTLAARVGQGDARPLLQRAGAGPHRVLDDLAKAREPLYREVADVIVEVDDVSAEQVADLVIAKVAELCES